MKTTKISGILILSSLVALLMMGFSEGSKNTTYAIGDIVEDFVLPSTEGDQISLSSFSDEKGVIVIFTCNTCPYAVAYEDRINDLHATYASKGYPVLAINPNDPEVQPGDSMEEMKKRKKEKNFQFHYLLDEKQEVFPRFGATKTPHVFLLQNTNKKSKLQYIGAIDDNYKDASQVEEKFLENAINSLENNQEVNPKETKAIGCTIKVAE